MNFCAPRKEGLPLLPQPKMNTKKGGSTALCCTNCSKAITEKTKVKRAQSKSDRESAIDQSSAPRSSTDGIPPTSLSLLSLAQWAGLYIELLDTFSASFPPKASRSRGQQLLFFLSASARLCILEQDARKLGRLSARELMSECLKFLSKRNARKDQHKRRRGIPQSIKDMAHELRSIAAESNGVIVVSARARVAEQRLMRALAEELRDEEFEDFNVFLKNEKQIPRPWP